MVCWQTHMSTKIRGFPAAQCGQGSVRVPPGTEPLAGQLGREEESVYTLLPPHTHTQPKNHAGSVSCPPLLLDIIYQSISVCLWSSENPPSLPQQTCSFHLSLSCAHTCSYMNGDEGWYLSSLSLLRSPADVHTARLTKHLEKHHKHIYKWWHTRRPDSLHRCCARTTKKQKSHNLTAGLDMTVVSLC